MFTLRTSQLLFISLLALSLSACTDNTNYTNLDDTQRVDRDRNQDSDADSDGGNQNSDYALTLLNDDDLEIYVGGSIDLNVLLTDGGQPVNNQVVTFEIVAGTGDNDTRLEAQSIYVNESGVAANRLRVGNTTGQIHVRARNAWVNDPLDIYVDVVTVPVNDLLVTLDHPDEDIFELSDFSVQLWPTSTLNCGLFPAYQPASEVPMDERSLTTLLDTALFTDLPIIEAYTVGVIGRGSHGQISARGCIQDVLLNETSLTEATVELELLPLAPAGIYDVISYWDFTAALQESGSVGSAIVGALEWVSNPGDQIATYLLDNIIEPFFCSNPSSDLCFAFDIYSLANDPHEDIQNFINDQISSIGVLNEIMMIGQDLMNMVSNMKVESVLTIDNKPVGEGEVEGRDRWLAMYFYWTRNCGPNDPADCGEIRVGLENNSDFGILESRWNGRVYDYNQLEIDPHDMTIPYGQVITLLLNEHLLPAITNGNANNLGQAFEYLLCSNLGGFSIAGVNFTAQQMQGYCSTVFSALGLAAELYVTNLEYSIDLHIGGVGTLTDLESNGFVDIIEDGNFLGQLYGEDGSSTDMNAIFSAERQQP